MTTKLLSAARIAELRNTVHHLSAGKMHEVLDALEEAMTLLQDAADSAEAAEDSTRTGEYIAGVLREAEAKR